MHRPHQLYADTLSLLLRHLLYPPPPHAMCRHQLLSRLKQYEALIQKLSVSVSVLLALQPTILFELAGLNMETGKQSSPPAQHYLHAAKRLRLTGSQVSWATGAIALAPDLACSKRNGGATVCTRWSADCLCLERCICKAATHNMNRSCDAPS